jgi:uncharacterized caspase-like protein
VAETRLALVIGNSGYTAVNKLPNPEHDAETIAAALKADGFDVTTVDNLTRAEFIAALDRFSDNATNADWAVVYFAGHGMQLDGVNYLIPVDAKLVADRDVSDEAIALDRVRYGLCLPASENLHNNGRFSGMDHTSAQGEWAFYGGPRRGAAHTT